MLPYMVKVPSGLGKIHSQLAKYPPILHGKTSNKINVLIFYFVYYLVKQFASEHIFTNYRDNN